MRRNRERNNRRREQGYGQEAKTGRNAIRGKDLLQAVLLLLLGLFLLTGAWAVRVQERLAGQVVRLHVLAASDSPEDQARKLRVRDAVLSRTEAYLRDAGDRGEAERILRSRLPDLSRAASDLLAREGCTDGVRLELAETDFPTRVYGGAGVSIETGRVSAYREAVPYGGAEGDGFALPAGRYLALRVVIGPGAGRNWWCVVFPPLCGGTEKEPSETADRTEREPARQGKVETGTGEKRTGEPSALENGTEKRNTPESGTGATPKQETAPTASPSAAPAAASAPAAPAAASSSATPAAATVRGLPRASQRYEVRFRIVELWGLIRASLG